MLGPRLGCRSLVGSPSVHGAGGAAVVAARKLTHRCAPQSTPPTCCHVAFASQRQAPGSCWPSCLRRYSCCIHVIALLHAIAPRALSRMESTYCTTLSRMLMTTAHQWVPSQNGTTTVPYAVTSQLAGTLLSRVVVSTAPAETAGGEELKTAWF